jgi:hypothetical protein
LVVAEVDLGLTRVAVRSARPLGTGWEKKVGKIELRGKNLEILEMLEENLVPAPTEVQ